MPPTGYESAGIEQVDVFWVEEAQTLRSHYREEDHRRVPSVIRRRCPRRDFIFQVTAPSAMVLQALIVGGRYSSTHPSQSPFQQVAAANSRLRMARGLALNASRTFKTILQFGALATVRCLLDAGFMCTTSLQEDKLVQSSTWLGFQGGCLSVGLAFLMGQTLAYFGRFVRASVYLALRLSVKLTGATLAIRLAGLKWPFLAKLVKQIARKLAWHLGTAVGCSFALAIVPEVATKYVRDLDSLTQQTQRLRIPFVRLFLQHCWRGCLPVRFHRHSSMREYWRWKVPETIDVPTELCCPITWQLLAQPVVLHGDIFERAALETWLERKPSHPLRADVSAFLDEVRPAEDLGKLCCDFAEHFGAQAVSVAVDSYELQCD